MAWSSDACAGGFMTAPGSSKMTGTETACEPPSAGGIYTRCCADTAAPIPAPAPDSYVPGITDVVGAHFVGPDECGSLDCKLHFTTVDYQGPNASFLTRGYNRMVPGPTLRVSAGTTLNLTIRNTLEDVNNGGVHNEYRHPNTTNVHTHGLHISGRAPSDDSAILIEPQAEYTYSYTLPANHMGGTFWYHPHHHGSAALQTGGGAYGMIVVEDQPGEVPEAVAKMPEVLLNMAVMNMEALVQIQNLFDDGSSLWQVRGTPSTPILVNGQSEPTLTVQRGKWYRWRIMFNTMDQGLGSSWQQEFTFKMATGTATCEMELLAKDGIYLNVAPRVVAMLPLYGGARADVAVRCSGRGTSLFVGATHGTAVRVSVAGADAGEPDLAPFSVVRPCYLADTRALAPDATSTVAFGSRLTINGFKYTQGNYLDSFETGTLVELTLAGLLDVHSFHMHVFPYQITEMNPIYSEYFQVGDWHDTLQDPSARATVRFFADKYTGDAVVHCHRTDHSDVGMMAVYEILGNEGAAYDTATLAGQTCYNGAGVRSVNAT